MPFQQQSLSARAIASLLWVAWLTLLLLLLPVASYGKTVSIQGTSGLVNQLDSLATLHDNHFRVGLVKAYKSEHSSTDIDPPDWLGLVSNSVLLVSLHCIVTSVSDYAGPEFSHTAYLRPQLRAPPQA
jgi:hypothetical protein